MRHSWAHKIILLRVPLRYFQSPACILVLFSQLHSFFISAELSQDAVEGLFLISWIFTLTVVPFISFSVKSIRQKNQEPPLHTTSLSSSTFSLLLEITTKWLHLLCS